MESSLCHINSEGDVLLILETHICPDLTGQSSPSLNQSPEAAGLTSEPFADEHQSDAVELF